MQNENWIFFYKQSLASYLQISNEDEAGFYES